jgi:hypothetical protein
MSSPTRRRSWRKLASSYQRHRQRGRQESPCASKNTPATGAPAPRDRASAGGRLRRANARRPEQSPTGSSFELVEIVALGMSAGYREAQPGPLGTMSMYFNYLRQLPKLLQFARRVSSIARLVLTVACMGAPVNRHLQLKSLVSLAFLLSARSPPHALTHSLPWGPRARSVANRSFASPCIRSSLTARNHDSACTERPSIERTHLAFGASSKHCSGHVQPLE